MLLHFLPLIAGLCSHREGALEHRLGFPEILQIERVVDANILKNTDFTIRVMLSRVKPQGYLVSVKRLVRIAEPSVQGAQVSVEVSLVASGQRMGGPFNVSVDMQRIFVAPEPLVKCCLI